LTGQSGDPAAAAKGEAVFAENCVACHGEDGIGMKELGAPALNTLMYRVSVLSMPHHLTKQPNPCVDAAVKAGRLSSAEEQRVLADLEQRIDDLVNGKLPDRFPRRHGFGFRDRQGPPAGFADPAA